MNGRRAINSTSSPNYAVMKKIKKKKKTRRKESRSNSFPFVDYRKLAANYSSTRRQIKISNRRTRPPRRTGVCAALRGSQTWWECAGKNQPRSHAHPPPVPVCGPRRRDQHLTPSVRASHIVRLPSGLTVQPWPSSPEKAIRGRSRWCSRVSTVTTSRPKSRQFRSTALAGNRILSRRFKRD